MGDPPSPFISCVELTFKPIYEQYNTAVALLSLVLHKKKRRSTERHETTLMEDKWLESPTKVKKDKKDRRRQQREQANTTPNNTNLPSTPEQAIIVTPERSKDKITGFWSLHDNEAPEPTDNSGEEEPPRTTVSDHWDIDDMTETNTHHTGNLQKYLLEKNPEEMRPNTAPTRLDLIRFKLNLVEALAKCKGAVGLDGGHAYLILSESEYRNWIGNPLAYLPTKPIVPQLPIKESDMTSAKAFFIKRAETALTLHKEFEQQTKDVLERKFPNGTIGLRDHTGKVPYSTPPSVIIDNIHTKIKDDMEDNQLYMEVVTDMMEKAYTPGKNGAAVYFQDMDDNQHLLVELGQAKLPNSLIVPKAQEAFHAQHDLKDMTKIAGKWKQRVKDNDYETDTKEYWDAFKNHYEQELKLLYKQMSDKQTKGKARYSADAMWRHNIQDELDATREELDSVSIALRTAINEQANLNKTTTPSTVTVPTAALSTVGSALTQPTFQGQGLDRLTAALVAALQATNGSQCQPPQPQGQPKNKVKMEQPWRQWNQYCWSCGVQLNHNSATCKHPKQGHDNHLSATYEDQQGGNTKRNHLWGKWCGPDINIYNEKGDTTKWNRPKANE